MSRALQTFDVVDTHTEGMPTRVVLGGFDDLPGSTMHERLDAFRSRFDDLRSLFVCEPRGHAAMYAAVVLPPLGDAADASVLYMEAKGYLPSCGHATIGVATALVETGVVRVADGVGRVVLETVSGPVDAVVEVVGGMVRAVALRNVPSFVLATDVDVDVVGCDGPLRVDVAYGGNFYAIVPASSAGVRVDVEEAPALRRLGLAVMRAVDRQVDVVHPTSPDIRGCLHTMFTEPAAGDRPARAAVVIYTGVLDRSPCGTGTSARMAQLWSRRELAAGEAFPHSSILGTSFVGRIVGETRVGSLPAVVPEVQGRAWVTGRGQLVLRDDDPFPAGFTLEEA